MQLKKEHPKFRFEQKYLMNATDITLLKSRAASLLRLDSHVKGQYYEIRSVYFDDMDNTCFMKNEAGTDERAKYRIRIYNHSDERIVLEKKIKKNGKTRKKSALLTRQQCDIFLRGENLSLDAKEFATYPELLKQFCVLVATRRMQPKVIVSYDRIPYVYKSGNVRVTFDLNISASKNFEAFFEKNLPKVPIQAAGRHLMEVKYDEFLPRFIRQSLELGNLRQTTFSKYYLCRKGIR